MFIRPVSLFVGLLYCAAQTALGTLVQVFCFLSLKRRGRRKSLENKRNSIVSGFGASPSQGEVGWGFWQRAKSPKKSDEILNLMTLPSMGVVLHSCSSPGGRGVKSRVSGLGTYSPSPTGTTAWMQEVESRQERLPRGLG